MNPTDSEHSPEQQATPEVVASALPEGANPLAEAPPAPSAEEFKDKWLRAVAEADNLRRRHSQELSQAHRYAVEKFASDLLAVKDSFEAVLADDKSSLEQIKTAVELTQRQLEGVFERFAITATDPIGERFDPNQHQAMQAIASNEHAPNTIVAVWQKGYRIHERVLRPALVVVSKGSDEQPA